MAKYIFVVGGVMSGVGKGIASASIGKILQSKGLQITALKIDPYVNVDAGTMNPTEHGEVFVLNDGTECDQDMGNYERFLNRDFSVDNYMTTGSVYLSVIKKERNMEYGGQQVEVVPRIPLEVIERIDKAAKKDKADVAVIEIGGTVGEYENILFLEAVRMLKIRKSNDVALVLVSFVPALGAGGTELKTKPTQHAVRSLNSVGLHPDFILGRAPIPLDEKRKRKIEFMCSIEPGNVISAPNVTNIYEVPINFEKDNFGNRILNKLGLHSKKRDLIEWKALVKGMNNAKKSVKIAIVGKYFGSGNFVLTDSYISVIEAVKHAAANQRMKPEIHWVDAQDFEKNPKSLANLKKIDGIIVPGGFGNRGVEGKMKAIEYCRKNRIPFFGLCLGMQLATIEFARNVCGLKDATSAEFGSRLQGNRGSSIKSGQKSNNPVIDVMEEQKSLIKEKKYGGTMRLGSYDCDLKEKTISRKAYGAKSITERHRHRYELNNAYRDLLEKHGMVMAGINPEKNLVEIIEIPKHPFFVATQFHPEFKSRPLSPHPLFLAFIKASMAQ